jgi:hypothetical protein
MSGAQRAQLAFNDVPYVALFGRSGRTQAGLDRYNSMAMLEDTQQMKESLLEGPLEDQGDHRQSVLED